MSLNQSLDNDDNSSSVEEEDNVVGHIKNIVPSLPDPVLRVDGRTIYTRGRPPWYHSDGRNQKPFLIGICGGSASGKTTVAREIIQCLDVPWVSMLCMDSYYKALSVEERKMAKEQNYDFDHPNAIDFKLLIDHLTRLRQGKSINVPVYDFKTHSRVAETKTLYGADIIIFEGVLAFHHKSLTDLMDLRVFVDTDADERLARRLRRDIAERGRDMDDVLQQYKKFVKPAYEQFIAPTMAIADLIIPRGGKNNIAIQLIVKHIKKRLDELGQTLRPSFLKKFQPNMESPEKKSFAMNQCRFIDHPLVTSKYAMPNNLYVLPYKSQFHALHTIIRDKETPQDAFVFYTDRLMRPLCEYACSLLPHEDVEVETPHNLIYKGRCLIPNTEVCGISILRAGEAIEHAFSAVFKDARIGKVLIQTNPDTMEPELHYIRLPSNIKDSYVFLFDSTVASGAAAIMAIRVLLDHDVSEERIILTSLLMAYNGVHSVAYTYPKVKIVTTAVDEELSDQYHIMPGLGNFGDRYFGTDRSEGEESWQGW